MGREPAQPKLDVTRVGLRASDGLASSQPLRLVVFLVGDTRYAIPLEGTERAFRMAAVSPLPGAPTPVVGALNLRGSAVPVVDLRLRFALAPREYGVGAHLLVVHTPRRRLAVAADEVLGVRELAGDVVAPARTLVSGLDPIAGIAALPDGLLLIHDLEALLSEDEERSLDQALEVS